MIQERKGLLLAGLALSLVGMLVSNSADAQVGYGGGGGGGADPNCFLTLQAPAGGFSVQVNGGASTVTTSNVQLTLNGGAAARMAISNDASFDGVSSESYQASRSWNLPAGLGSKTVYVRFYNSCGIASAVFSAAVEVVAPTVPGNNPGTNNNENNGGQVLGEKINASIDDLIARLRYGQRNEDVRALQQALAEAGLMPRNWRVTNYYGPVTLAAATRYVDSHPGNLDELIGRLRYGTSHPDVRRLQRLLIDRKLMPRGWRISSYYGTATRSAVARYQAAR